MSWISELLSWSYYKCRPLYNLRVCNSQKISEWENKRRVPSFFCCLPVLSSATVHLLKPRIPLDFFSHFEFAGFTSQSYEVLSCSFFYASTHFSFTAAVNKTKGSKKAYLIQLLDLDKTQFLVAKHFLVLTDWNEAKLISTEHCRSFLSSLARIWTQDSSL